MSIDLTQLPNTEFDWPQTLKIHRGNEMLASQLSHMLQEQLPEFQDSFSLAYNNQDWVALAQQVHKLRGGLCYLSAPRLNQLLKHLETDILANQTDNIEDLYTLALTSMSRLRDVLSA